MEPTDQPNPKTTSETDVINPKESNSDKFEESLSVIDSRLLKTGDYQLHIFIEETRGLVPRSKDALSTLDPLIKIQAFDTTKHSSQKESRGSGMIYWGEHLFFTKEILETSSFEFEKLHLSLWDHNMLGSDGLIGEFDLDLISIYFSNQHSLLHQWVALSNYKSDFEQIQGFLKFSANCVGPEDVQVSLHDEETVPDGKNQKQLFSDSALGPLAQGRVLIPPQIHTKGWQLKINLARAENLIKMDNWAGSIDSFLVITFGSVEYKTKIIKDNINPIWNIEILMPFSEPSINDHITFKVYDWDRGKKDELVASANFSKKQILSGKFSIFFWLNLYGSQSNGDSKVSAIMNNNPTLATLWKGRILLSLLANPQENPKLSSQKTTEPLSEHLIKQLNNKDLMEWCLIAEIHYGLCFPSKKNHYQIEIRWADQELTFGKAEPKGNLWEWYSRQKFKCPFPYTSFNDLPDVFIYLKDGSDRLCFIRETAEHFINNLIEKPKFYFFKPELSKNPGNKCHEAGLIKMRIAIGFIDMFDEFNASGWGEELVRPTMRNIYLFANMYHAKELIPADDDGSSDPFYSLEYYGVEEISDVIHDSLNPIWYKSHKMIVPFFGIDEMPPLIIKFYDKDKFGSEYIGHRIISLQQGIIEGFVYFNKAEVPEPKWLDLNYDQGKGAGKILVSFNILESLPLNYLPSIYPSMDKYHVSLRILGLRNLKTLGLFPVKRPYIKFDINSLRPAETKQNLSEKMKIETQPKESGENPNLSTLISFDIELPKDYSLCPTLNCVVYDCILKGFKQPVLGHFSIDLEVFIRASRERMKKKLKKYASKLSEKNTAFSQISDLIQKKNENKISKSYSPLKEQIPQLIELSSDKDIAIKEPLLDHPEILVEKKSRNGYSEIGAENKGILLDLEMGYNPKVFNEDGSIDSTAIVRKAQYEYSPIKKTIIEANVPDPNYYTAIGYDPKESRLNNPFPKRHYRFHLDKPLETSHFLDKNTFDEFQILRGKRFQSESFLSKIAGGESKEKTVGLFKGWIDITSLSLKETLLKEYPKKLLEEIEANRSFESINLLGKTTTIDLNKEFIEKTVCLVRAYILSATSLAQMDEDSLSDPYLVVKLGDQTQNNEKEYQQDKTNCEFNKMFEFKTILPGASQLQIQVWDKDFLVKDDLIGETSIDLENRYFSKRFRRLVAIPIETRPLYHPLSKLEKGRIKLWLEVIPVKNTPDVKLIWDLTPRPPCFYELRIVIWDVEGVPSQDIEDCSDLFVSAMVGEEKQKTDTHFRSQNGSGSFNWRMVWDVVMPMKDPTVTFQVWDKDFFSPSDFIAEATLSFKKEANSGYENENIEKIYGNKKVKVKQKNSENGQTLEREITVNDDKFVIELQNCKKSGYVLKEVIGKLTVSLELIPKNLAENTKVGLGRNEPNHSPWLPPPVGRFEFSWNPLTLFNRCVGPKARRKVCICLCMTICSLMLMYMLPTIIGGLFTTALKKIF